MCLNAAISMMLELVGIEAFRWEWCITFKASFGRPLKTQKNGFCDFV